MRRIPRVLLKKTSGSEDQRPLPGPRLPRATSGDLQMNGALSAARLRLMGGSEFVALIPSNSYIRIYTVSFTSICALVGID